MIGFSGRPRLNLWWILGVVFLGILSGSLRAQDLTTTGTFVTIWVDPPTPGKYAPPIHMLSDGRGHMTRLEVPDELILRAGGLRRLNGARVSLEGRGQAAMAVGSDRQIDVERLQITSAAPQTHALLGSRPQVVILCQYSDVPADVPASLYFPYYTGTTPGSADYYWREISNGQMNVSGSAVVGWYDLPRPYSYYMPGGLGTAPDFAALLNDCTAAADADVDFTRYVGVILVLSGDVGGGSYGASSQNVTLDGQVRLIGVNWMGGGGSANGPSGGIAHEMGHNFGLMHSSGPYANTYDSDWDVMSYLVLGFYGQHTIAYHKDLLGWLPAARVFVPSTPGSTTIQLERGALPTNSGYLMARLPIPGGSGQFYTIEARRRIGLDSVLPLEGVLLHRVDPTRGDRVAQVVDVDGNGDPNDAGAIWTPGETFVDASSGIEVQVNSTYATGYDVTITTGGLPSTRTLSLQIAGGGEVTVNRGGVTKCAVSCSMAFVNGTTTSLLALPGPAQALAGWGGDCASWDSSTICNITMNSDKNITVTFVPGFQARLTLSGQGTVLAFTPPLPAAGNLFGCSTESPNYGSHNCSQAFGWMPADSAVDFFQYPAAGWSLGPWGGDCTGAALIRADWCHLVANGSKVVTVDFVGGPSLSVSLLGRGDSVPIGSVIPVADSANLIFTGGSAAWTASTPNSWIHITNPTGNGTAKLRWTRDPSSLVLGTHIGVIHVTSAGSYGSPAVIVDTLNVLAALSLALNRTSGKDSVVAGSTVTRADSGAVTLSGFGASSKPWSASHGGSAWLVLTTAGGQGSGMVRWNRNPTGVGIGTYVDTITVTAVGALGSPWRLIDTLKVLQPLTGALGGGSREDSLPQGSTSAVTANSAVTLTGFNSGSSGWVATHGGSLWLTVTTASGTGSGTVQWKVNPTDLNAGLYVDTIKVTVSGAAGSPLQLIDSLRIYEPAVAIACAESVLFSNAGCMGAVERNFLDMTGNDDGSYNLGDLLAYLDRKGLPLSPPLLEAVARGGMTPAPRRPR